MKIVITTGPTEVGLVDQFFSIVLKVTDKSKMDKTCVINDPLGQTHSLASSEHCFRLKVVLF